MLPDLWLRTLGDVVLMTRNERGGHFAAHEQPGWIARDLKVMMGKGGKAFGCVDGKDGYWEVW